MAFIGLGVMGYPMAGHLSKAGHSVRVYNRTGEVAERWCNEYAGSTALTPREAAEQADFVMCCVGNDDDVRSVLLGDDGALVGMKSGTVLIDHTTASATLAEELGQFAQGQQVHFLDAPVSGGEAGAVNGQLTIMIGGEPETFDKARPVLDVYAKACQLIGPTGHGQMAKMVNQLCIAGLVQGLAEGMHFAAASGLDTDKVIAAISQGAAQSWQMDNRAHTMLRGEFEFGFAVDWMRKDLSIALDAARKAGVELPVSKAVDGYYEEVQEMGGGRWDTSSLIARFQRKNRH
ncbi:MAG: NAD(P)-dependent oxidoreductase [Gammaproteobacteria bacterium]